ncbi:MAG: hypothetical protein ABFD84_13000 [Candidatus Polarisedimenticolia bacterium]|nr:hypothetical protein [bacterium]
MNAWPAILCAASLLLVGCDEKREKAAACVSPDGRHVATVFAGRYNVTARDTVFVYVEAAESRWSLFHSKRLVLFCVGYPELVSVRWMSDDKLVVRFAAMGNVVRKDTAADGVSIVFEEVTRKEMERSPAA